MVEGSIEKSNINGWYLFLNARLRFSSSFQSVSPVFRTASESAAKSVEFTTRYCPNLFFINGKYSPSQGLRVFTGLLVRMNIEAIQLLSLVIPMSERRK